MAERMHSSYESRIITGPSMREKGIPLHPTTHRDFFPLAFSTAVPRETAKKKEGAFLASFFSLHRFVPQKLCWWWWGEEKKRAQTTFCPVERDATSCGNGFICTLQFKGTTTIFLLLIFSCECNSLGFRSSCNSFFSKPEFKSIFSPLHNLKEPNFCLICSSPIGHRLIRPLRTASYCNILFPLQK